MKVEIFETDQNDELCFAVHFAPTLPFPDDRKQWPNVERFAVVATSFKASGWSYICLNQDAKDTIGTAMLAHGCDTLKWYWCQITEYDDSEIILRKSE